MATIAGFLRPEAFVRSARFSWPRLAWARPAPESDPDACRARMEVVKEMMQSCPEAFASELDIERASIFLSRRY